MITQHFVEREVKSMANTQLLEDLWKNSGKSKTYIAKKANISRPRLNYIFKNPETATMQQANVIATEIGAKAVQKADIFLP